jgi:hypothetical protein
MTNCNTNDNNEFKMTNLNYRPLDFSEIKRIRKDSSDLMKSFLIDTLRYFWQVAKKWVVKKWVVKK